MSGSSSFYRRSDEFYPDLTTITNTNTPTNNTNASPSFSRRCLASPSTHRLQQPLSNQQRSPTSTSFPISPLVIPIPRSGSMALRSFPSTPDKSTFGPATRTVAILMKSAAKVHRLAIQSRIIEAGFEILAERSERWSSPEDDDFIQDFLSHQVTADASTTSSSSALDPKAAAAFRKWAPRLTTGAVYILVLERHRAPAAWEQLLGKERNARGSRSFDEEDDEQEEEQEQEEQEDQESDLDLGSLEHDGFHRKKHGLRHTYGSEAFYGSPSEAAAEAQIRLCFPELSHKTPVGFGDAGPTTPHQTSPESRMQLASSSTSSSHSPALRASSQSQRDDGEILVDSDQVLYDSQGRAFDAQTGEELSLQEEIDDYPNEQYHGPQRQRAKEREVDSSGRKVFRARPVPPTNRRPSIEPRMSKAAALRMGIEIPQVSRPRKGSLGDASSSAGSEGPLGISGLPRAEVPKPASLRPPTVAPRLNKAAAVRTGQELPERKLEGARERRPVDFSSTPGHKRSGVEVKVASIAAPSIVPRANRASMARMSVGGINMVESSNATGAIPSAPSPQPNGPSASLVKRSTSTSFVEGLTSEARERKPVNFSDTPGHKRASLSISVASLAKPAVAPRANRASLARMSMGGGGGGGLMSPASSARQVQPHGRADDRAEKENRARTPSNSSNGGESRTREDLFANTPGHKRMSMNFHIPSLASPSIAPRSNNAALSRLAKVGGIGFQTTTEKEATRHARPKSAAGLGSVLYSARMYNAEKDATGTRTPSRGHHRRPPSSASSYVHDAETTPWFEKGSGVEVGGGGRGGGGEGMGVEPHQDGQTPRSIPSSPCLLPGLLKYERKSNNASSVTPRKNSSVLAAPSSYKFSNSLEGPDFSSQQQQQRPIRPRSVASVLNLH